MTSSTLLFVDAGQLGRRWIVGFVGPSMSKHKIIDAKGVNEAEVEAIKFCLESLNNRKPSIHRFIILSDSEHAIRIAKEFEIQPHEGWIEKISRDNNPAGQYVKNVAGRIKSKRIYK